jgi:hypothetical protein
MTTLMDEAERLLLHQFSNSKRVVGLIRALTTPFQEALTELERLHDGRYIDQAADETLDVIGDIVGQPRVHMTDANYRPWIKVAIHLNNSAGTVENVLTILTTLFGKKAPVVVQEYPPNAVIFAFLERPSFSLATLKKIVLSAVPITTNCQITTGPNAMEAPALSTNNIDTEHVPLFRFDYSRFDESCFSDFIEEEI